MTEKLEVKEADKPFILALVSSGTTILCIIGGFLGLPFAEDGLKASIPLTTMAWTFYFVKKE